MFYLTQRSRGAFPKKQKRRKMNLLLRTNNFRRGALMYNGWNFWSGSIVRQISTDDKGRLAGKVALITGGASGIGKETALQFSQQGARVVIADVQHELGKDVSHELGPSAAFIPCDVSQESQISAAVDFAVSNYGCLDIMFNNAGICGSISHGIVDLDMSEFNRVMSVNVYGVVAGIKHAARAMIPRRRGCILCTASVTGILGGMAPHAYSISKFAVAGAVKSVASELCKHGIRVNCISPFAVPTPFAADAVAMLFPGADEGRISEIIHGASELEGAKCEPADIAKAALYLASDDAKFVSGHNLVVDGGFTTCKPMQFSDGKSIEGSE